MELRWSSVLADAYKFSNGYLLTSVAVAVGAVLFVWLYEMPALNQLFSKSTGKRAQCGEESAADGGAAEAEDARAEGEGARQLDARSLVQQISAEMTPEQRDHERAVEREQLAAIFKLLREQEDKFNVSSMEQLQEQLNLYR